MRRMPQDCLNREGIRMTSIGLPTVVSLIDRRPQNIASEPHVLSIEAAHRLCVRGIVFDMAGVLYEGTICQRWLWQLLLRLGVQADYTEFCDRWERDYLDEVNRGVRSYEEAQHAFLLSYGLSPAQVEEVQAATPIRRGEVDLGVRPLPGVSATLAKLAVAGFRLAVLANSWCTATVLRQMLDQLGLSPFISSVLSSCDLGNTTPAAECYGASLKAIELPACEALYVGREPRSLTGATTMGMHTAAFNQVAGATADYYLHRFDELGQLVQQPAVFRHGSPYDRSAA